MAFAGKCDKKENITAAVAANIWMSNEKSARSAFLDESLQYIVMDCEVWHSPKYNNHMSPACILNY